MEENTSTLDIRAINEMRVQEPSFKMNMVGNDIGLDLIGKEGFCLKEFRIS
jgi:hypothetical protein